MEFLISLAINAVAVFLMAAFLPGLRVKNFMTALLTGALFAMVNASVSPLAKVLALPLHIVVLGLVFFTINLLMLLLIDKLFEGFELRGFTWACLFSLLISLLNAALRLIF